MHMHTSTSARTYKMCLVRQTMYTSQPSYIRRSVASSQISIHPIRPHTSFSEVYKSSLPGELVTNVRYEASYDAIVEAIIHICESWFEFHSSNVEG